MGGDLTGAGERWIPQEEYDLIRASVPILCVDLLVLSNDAIPRIGLIRRDTYDNGQGWCIVGGAVLRDEPLVDAVERHLKATLGESFALNPSTLQLQQVIEYFTKPNVGSFYDPRKHAVALTYSARCSGTPQAQGEAHEFAWFPRHRLHDIPFGFGQDRVVDLVLRKMHFP
jgi:ADP-ribose pyrophosphatase YjhB (NUDIX family)